MPGLDPDPDPDPGALYLDRDPETGTLDLDRDPDPGTLDLDHDPDPRTVDLLLDLNCHQMAFIPIFRCCKSRARDISDEGTLLVLYWSYCSHV